MAFYADTNLQTHIRWKFRLKMNHFNMLSLVCLAFLSGCAALKENVAIREPSENPRARIRVLIPSVLNVYRGVRGYPNSACVGSKVDGNGNIVSSQLGFEKHLNGQSLGMPTTELSQRKNTVKAEFFAVADQPISFRYLIPDISSLTIVGSDEYRTRIPGCTANISMTPEAGADYELAFELGASGKCAYEARKLVVRPSEGDSTASLVSFPIQEVGACDLQRTVKTNAQ
jgi:hypothetical protein